MENQKEPFPQFIDKNPKKHFHWAMFLIVALGLAATLLIVIENFKTQEEIDSMIPMYKHQTVVLPTKVPYQLENIVIYKGQKVEFGKLTIILKSDTVSPSGSIKEIQNLAKGTIVFDVEETNLYVVKFDVQSMEELDLLKNKISVLKEVEYVGYASAELSQPN